MLWDGWRFMFHHGERNLGVYSVAPCDRLLTLDPTACVMGHYFWKNSFPRYIHVAVTPKSLWVIFCMHCDIPEITSFPKSDLLNLIQRCVRSLQGAHRNLSENAPCWKFSMVVSEILCLRDGKLVSLHPCKELKIPDHSVLSRIKKSAIMDISTVGKTFGETGPFRCFMLL